MSFSDHKITQFTHKITDLPDQPTLAPNELKARFDSSPEELRQAVNGICDDASRLEARVEGIVVDTFGDTIDREMLSDELAAELDAKATQAALSDEAGARTQSDNVLADRLTANETLTAQKCEIYCGSYAGNWSGNSNDPSTQTITLGFQAKAVVISSSNANSVSGYGATLAHIALEDAASPYVSITSTGFQVSSYMNFSANGPFRYVALK
ncbi:hypothetical protein AGATL06_10610 [Agathobaculum sp. TL06]